MLYEIDARPYKAAYDSAVALVAQNKANLKLAQENNDRFKTLAKTTPGAVSPQDLDKYQSTEEQAAAAIEQSQANLETAKLNLGWTKVTAPVSGRISRFLVTQGNLIAADQTVLTTIVSQDPMYAYFDVDEPTVLRVKELIRQGKVAPYKQVKYPVFLGLSLETDRQTQNQLYPHEGQLDFVNNQLDQATATLQARGVFANPMPPPRRPAPDARHVRPNPAADRHRLPASALGHPGRHRGRPGSRVPLCRGRAQQSCPP